MANLASKDETIRRLIDPHVGDYFDEHLTYKLWVLAVDTQNVVYADTLGCEKRYEARMAALGNKPKSDIRCETPIDLQLNKVSRNAFAKKTYIDYVGHRSVEGWLEELTPSETNPVGDLQNP